MSRRRSTTTTARRVTTVNHWYKLPIMLDPTIEEDVKAEEGEFANKPSGENFSTSLRMIDQPETLRQREEEQGNPTVLK